MTLYEIDQSIIGLMNEDGEIADLDAFEALQMERDEKIENIALWIKNLASDAKALKAEEESLAERRKAAENKSDSLKRYLASVLDGAKFETPRVKCSWRKSVAIEYTTDEAAFVDWAKGMRDDLLTYRQPAPDKTAIKEAIKDGAELPLVRLAERNNLSIK